MQYNGGIAGGWRTELNISTLQKWGVSRAKIARHLGVMYISDCKGYLNY